MAYAGLRFGEVRDLRWQDLLLDRGTHGMIRVQLGGSAGTTTKGGRSRQIPIHPRLREFINALARSSERVFSSQPSKRWGHEPKKLNERTVIQVLKKLCAKLKFENAEVYKLHTFRHAFASMCARNNTSYKYALQFMGHKSSEILDLYYTMYDSTAEAAIGTINYSPMGTDTDGKSDAA
jgi:integrase